MSLFEKSRLEFNVPLSPKFDLFPLALDSYSPESFVESVRMFVMLEFSMSDLMHDQSLF